MKAHLKRRYRRDEHAIARLLEMEGSLACSIRHYLDLDRVNMQAVVPELSDDRQSRMVFPGVACGTFPKCFDREGRLHPANCSPCEEKCSLVHLRRHVGLGAPPPREDRGALVSCSLASLIPEVAPCLFTGASGGGEVILPLCLFFFVLLRVMSLLLSSQGHMSFSISSGLERSYKSFFMTSGGS